MREEEGTACKEAIVFFVFCTPDERKNPDWSDLINYLIHPSDWLATCHSKPLGLHTFYIFNKADKSRDRFELIHLLLADASFQNYYSDQIMEVEAINLTG